MKNFKDIKCNGCNDDIKKNDKYVKIGDVIFCEHCINENWHECE